MTADRGRRRALLASAARPLAIFAASRLVVLAAMVVAGLLAHAQPGGHLLPLRKQFTAWDASWYTELVRHGYPRHLPIANGRAVSSTFGFFPLFPLAARAAGAVFRLGPLAAGTLVTTALAALACVLLWLFTARLTDRGAADRAVALFALSPGAFVLGLAYAESMMLVLAIACLWLLIERRWLLAGAAAALAGATRPNGIALLACCAAAALLLLARTRRWRPTLPALAGVALAPLGLLAFFLFLRQRTGTARAYLRTQQDGWGLRFSLTGPWTMVHKLVDHPGDVNLFVGVAAMVVSVVLLVILWRAALPPVLFVFALAVVAMGTLSTAWAPLRFVLTAFPFAMALGLRVKGVPYAVLLGVSAALLALTTVLVVSTPLLTP